MKRLPVSSVVVCAVVATAACCLVAWPAAAALILYEPFDYGSSSATLVGKGGSELGFKASETWATDVGTATYVPTSLSFGLLRVAGGHAFCTNSAIMNTSRGIETNATGVIYGSFLWQPNVSLAAANISEGINFGGQYSTYGSSEFAALPTRDTAAAGRSSAYVKGSNGDCASGATAVLGTNYLALFKVTNVGGPNGATNTVWLLTVDQFTYFKASGLTDSALNAATIGSATNSVYQRASYTHASAYPTLTNSLYLNLRNYLSSGSPVAGRYDEIRIAAGASASLDEVTPLTPAIIDNTGGASNVTAVSATLCGALTLTSAPTQVYCFWGPINAGSSVANWAHTNSLGATALGPVTNAVSGLCPGTPYYYTFYATNANGSGWSPAVTSFVTPMTPNGFQLRLPLTFAGYTRDETLADFPALVVLSTNIPGFSYDQFLAPQGADLRFSDDAETNTLCYEVEEWNPAGNSYVWVRVPQLVNNLVIKAFWGRGDAPVPSYATNGLAWNSGYAAVWHMNDTDKTIRDSTTNFRHASASGDTHVVTGVIGRGQEFDGTNDFVLTTFGKGLNPSTQPLTYSAWAKADRPTSTNGVVLAQGSYGPSDTRGYLGANLSNWAFGVYNSSWATAPNAGPADSAPHMLSLVFSGTVASLYLDGAYKCQKTYASYQFNSNLFIGAYTLTDRAYDWDGSIDEVRVSTTARSSNWIWACYMSQASNSVFGVAGSATPVLAGGPQIANTGAVNVDTHAADLVGCLVTNAPATVICYWGTNNVTAADPAQWMTNTPLGSVAAEGPVTNQLTGLLSGTPYWFRYYATNGVAGAWAVGSALFVTRGAITPDNADGAVNVMQTNATLQGRLLGGNPVTLVRIYWGTNDGGTDTNAWNRAPIDMGQPQVLTTFSTPVIGMLANQTNWYRCYASNEYGEAWAPASTNFVTLSPSISIGNASVTEGLGNATTTAAFTVSLSVVSAMDVTFTFQTSNGTGTAGADYVALGPQQLTIPAGSVSTTILVTVNDDYVQETNETFAVVLSGPVNATIAQGTGIGTIGNDDFVPTVNNSVGATGVQTNSAWLNGVLASTGTAATVFWGVCYGTNDAGASLSAWSRPFLDLGQASGVPVTNASQVTGLLPNTTYYYRYYASNLAGQAWAPTAASFLTRQLGAPQRIYWSDGDGNTSIITEARWNDLQDAVNAAGNVPATPGMVKLSGDFARVPGDATVGSVAVDKANLTLSGGWDAAFAVQGGMSVLDVKGSSSASNQFRVMQITASNVLVRNIVATNGWAATSGGGGIQVSGAAGVFLQNLVVVNNTCPNNYNNNSGGGIALNDAIGARVSDCDIVDNIASDRGGGIEVFQSTVPAVPTIIERCRIRRNRTIKSNYAWDGNRGGGLDSNYAGSGAPFVVLANCRIDGNQSRYGSGICLAGWASSKATIFGCLITSNSWNTPVANPGLGNALDTAGFRGPARLVNCTVADNVHPSSPGQFGIYVQPDNYDVQRVTVINSITKSNDAGYRVDRKASGGGFRYADFQNTTVTEAKYLEVDVVEGYVTNTTFASALSTVGNATPGYTGLDATGGVTHAMQQNIDGDPGFKGSGADPYQITLGSTSADSGLAHTDGRGFKYVDVDLNNVYTTNIDIIVSGTPPSGSHLVYTTDLLGNPRMSTGGAIDRGAYQHVPPGGTAMFFR
jgi:hypothetical protein